MTMSYQPVGRDYRFDLGDVKIRYTFDSDTRATSGP